MSDSSLRATLVPWSSIVGQSIRITQGDGAVVAQLAVLTPNGPPPGEDHKSYAGRIAQVIADKINKTK